MAFVEAAEEGVTDFVDDSLGFLPPMPSVGANDAWNHDRRLAGTGAVGSQHAVHAEAFDRPIRRDRSRRHDHPPEAVGWFRPASGDFEVIVRGGHSQGHCEIDRKTGLPVYGEIKRRIDMEVRLADGRHFDQQKTTTTTIRLFPQQESSEPPGRVIPASAENFPRDNNSKSEAPKSETKSEIPMFETKNRVPIRRCVFV